MNLRKIIVVFFLNLKKKKKNRISNWNFSKLKSQICLPPACGYIELAQKLFGFFCYSTWTDPKELLGQPNIYSLVHFFITIPNASSEGNVWDLLPMETTHAGGRPSPILRTCRWDDLCPSLLSIG